MRPFAMPIATILVFIGGSTAIASDCGSQGNTFSSNKTHSYELTVTSTSEDPVRITGSVVLMGPDNYFQIHDETPYQLTASGVNLLFIVSAVDSADTIDFSLAIDGQVSTSGEDNTVYAVGQNIPKPDSLFSANYLVVVADR